MASTSKSSRSSKSSKKDAAASEKAAKKQKAKGKRAWKMIGTGVGLASGIATTKALEATWRTATGHKPPNKPENPDIAGREALLWAAISGSAMGLAKTYATRRAALYWIRSTGDLPPGMADEASNAAEKRKIKKQALSR